MNKGPNETNIRDYINSPNKNLFQVIKFAPASERDKKELLRHEYNKLFTGYSPLKKPDFGSFLLMFRTMETGNWDEDIKNYIGGYKRRERELVQTYITGCGFETEEVSYDEYNPEYIKGRNIKAGDLIINFPNTVYNKNQNKNDDQNKNKELDKNEDFDQLNKKLEQLAKRVDDIEKDDEFFLFKENRKKLLGNKRERIIELEKKNDELQKKIISLQETIKRKDLDYTNLEKEKNNLASQLDIECTICLIPYRINDYFLMNCGHCLCKKCIDLVRNGRIKECPICKKQVYPGLIKKIFI